MLLTSGDLEKNPGPSTAQMLEKILENQAASDAKMDAMRQDISYLTSKSDKLAGYLDVIEEMGERISSLESLVRQQADKLTEYENKSRRNNLLVFGLPEVCGFAVESASSCVPACVSRSAWIRALLFYLDQLCLRLIAAVAVVTVVPLLRMG
ncbi:hypothetical protein HPB50_000292 [Hyalomma asiaticum]|uniref:Uncharacterized protein n=1 Tax=Hyalomma asiaticum TaxID=266040 RepID=A0ACB7RSA3_HYAAI|nr:hypothetical protein HPB50_000292 [Hyalomma asiaticum]